MRIIALEYHDIVPAGRWEDSGFPGPAAATYKLAVDRFAGHLDAVRDTGAPICSDIGEIERAGSGSTRVVWTFDDGGTGYAAHAADLLEGHGWRGHLFMTTAQIGRAGFLTGADLRDLHQRGHVVGTHSRTHPHRMSDLSASGMSEEWRASVEDLQAVLGGAVKVGSVPGGFYSSPVAVAAAEQGLRYLFTSEPTSRVQRVAGCAVIGRFTLRQGDPPRYAARMVSNPATRGVQWCQWNAKKVAKSLAGNVYARVRTRVLDR